MNRHTHVTTTVTLAAQAHRGLITSTPWCDASKCATVHDFLYDVHFFDLTEPAVSTPKFASLTYILFCTVYSNISVIHF